MIKREDAVPSFEGNYYEARPKHSELPFRNLRFFFYVNFVPYSIKRSQQKIRKQSKNLLLSSQSTDNKITCIKPSTVVKDSKGNSGWDSS